jgi:hypothetical protein
VGHDHEVRRRPRLKGVQLPSWDGRLIDLEKAAASKHYCDDFAGIARANGVEITELGTHLQGQLVAAHPAYDEAFDAFAPDAVKGNPKARQQWAVQQVLWSAKASKHLGLKSNVSFPGALAWPYLCPWRRHPAGLIETAFDELAKRWLPIFNTFDEAGCSVAFELHPGEDLFDGTTFEMFLERVKNHPRCCINYDPRTCCSSSSTISSSSTSTTSASPRCTSRTPNSVRPAGRACTRAISRGAAARRALPLAGRRPGRFRRDLLEDGAVPLRRLGGARMGVLPEAPGAGRCRGAAFILDHIIRVTEKAFDDFAGGASDPQQLRRMLGIWRWRSKRRRALPLRLRPRTGASTSAWSAAVRARSSVACTGWRRASTTTTSSSPARSRRRRRRRCARAVCSASPKSAATPATPRWRRPRRRASKPMASRRSRSSRRTTCTRRSPRPS